METEMLEQVALDEEMAESVWREMIEASTEAAIMLYLAPPEMPEDEPIEGGILSADESLDKGYESSEEKYSKESLVEYRAEPDEEEKSLYEKQVEERANQEDETNQENKEGENYEG